MAGVQHAWQDPRFPAEAGSGEGRTGDGGEGLGRERRVRDKGEEGVARRGREGRVR